MLLDLVTCISDIRVVTTTAVTRAVQPDKYEQNHCCLGEEI
jgi:hypothetical protein